MKKILLGSTAIVAAGLLAQPAMASDPIKLDVKGYYQNLVTYSDTDRGNTHDFQFRHEGEVFFIGSTKLDNGLTVGFDAQLEIVNVNAAGGRHMDETYLWLEGGFGKVILGAENSAAYLTHVGAPSFGLGFDDRNFGVLDLNGGRTRQGLSNDNNKGTYLTPRIAGFQAGISYNPDNTAGKGDQRYNFANVPANVVGNAEDVFSGGINYTGKFGDFGLRASVGYETASVAGAGFDDPESVALGLSVSFAGFTVGGAYKDADNMNTNDGYTNGVDSKVWGLGVSYAVGPWGLSALVNYNDNENQPKNKEYELAAMYQVGPGVQFRGGLQHGDTGSANRDSTVVFVGTFLSF